jgi:hypothetical protein
VFAAAAALAILHASPAWADGQDEAGARALFNAGRESMKAGHYPEACAQFEAARKLFTSSGLLLNLANCHEHISRTASAWTEFADAAYAAANSGRKQDEVEAKRRQAALQDKLSMLSIRVDGATSDEVVKRDGASIDRSVWGTAIPVDPGTHLVEVTATGRRTWSKSVEVTEAGKTVVVQVPALDPVPVAAPAPAPALPAPVASRPAPAEPVAQSPVAHVAPLAPVDAHPEGAGNGQRVAGWAIGGVGLLGMGASGVLGLVANSQFHSAEGEAGGARHTDSVHAGQLADIATGVLIGGAVVTAAGVVVWMTAPRARVAVGLSGLSAVVGGSF